MAAGVAYADVSNAGTLHFGDKLHTPRGHGFAAERANHLADLYLGRDAQIVGDDNAKNGTDRMVDGVPIQFKYCATGAKCVQECFEDGAFRYRNADGTPMQIEVPSDLYDAAVQAMESRIERGEVPGVTDSAEAKNIIRKGHFTYAQAKNITRAGTVESIVYDAASGAIIAVNAFGVAAVLTFATALWNGETPEAALLVNAFRSGTNIYGAAAMKSAAKMLRGNAITGAVLDHFIEDDADRMVAILQAVFTELAEEYLTTQAEAETIVEALQERLTGKTLQKMYASDDRHAFARALLEDAFRVAAENRAHVALPTEEQMQQGLRLVLEEAAGAMGDDAALATTMA